MPHKPLGEEGDAPPELSHEAPDLTPLHVAADADVLPVIKSVLAAAGIPYFVPGDEAEGLFPVGGLIGFFSDETLGTTILVPSDRADEARELLASEARIDPTPSDERSEP